MVFIWFWLGSVYAVLLAGMAVDSIRHKTPWRELTPAAVVCAVALGGIGALMHLVVAWVEQSGWSGVLAVIGFLGMVFALSYALVGGVLRALYRD